MSTELPDHFAGAVAERYDAGSPEMFAPDVLGPTVDLLAGLAGAGPALELAIGTGRVALPLHERGVDVYGIDLSPDMVAQLRAKPGGDDVEVVIGDFATAAVGPKGDFTLAYLVFNTIGNLTTQDAQVDAFRNASAHLRTGGTFVIETGVPDLRRLTPGETDIVFHRDAEHVGVDELDVVTQRMVSHHYNRVGDHYELVSVPFRYVWPSELDLMARIAGMRLRDRWAGWTREAFTA
ncbi:MAG TPA: class I SAM-dependent methyltransferase, partial [Lapillicoccus sp.]|nr:class I SAM-dependent methyltransferase [Lapillicoccus sp.]